MKADFINISRKLKMSNKKIFTCILLPFLFILSACSTSSNLSDTSSMQSLDEGNSPYISVNDIKNFETIEETEYYKIVHSDFMFYYYIFDENHNVVKSGGPLNREPHISMVNNHLIRFTLQTGTGIGTQWGYYYDAKADVFSRIFQSIYDQCDSKVAYGKAKKVIVRDIFDKTEYYKEISSFQKPFSDVVEPITDVKFVNDGTGIEVSYLTGVDYKEVTEIIKLN